MHITIRQICIPTDFSEAADLAVRYAAALAEHHGAGLHVLHVLEHAADLVHHPDFSGTGEVAHAYFERLEREEDFDRLEREVGWEQESDSKREDADASVHQFFETLLTPALLMFAFTGAVWKTQRRNEEVLGLDAVRASSRRWRFRDGRHRRE